MKKKEKTVCQIIRFRGKIETFLVSIDEFSSNFCKLFEIQRDERAWGVQQQHAWEPSLWGAKLTRLGENSLTILHSEIYTMKPQKESS